MKTDPWTDRARWHIEQHAKYRREHPYLQDPALMGSAAISAIGLAENWFGYKYADKRPQDLVLGDCTATRNGSVVGIFLAGPVCQGSYCFADTDDYEIVRRAVKVAHCFAHGKPIPDAPKPECHCPEPESVVVAAPWYSRLSTFVKELFS